jgi:endonuclease III
MQNIGTKTSKTSTGFAQTLTLYRAKNCEGCPMRGACHNAKENRTIEVNHNLNKLKQQADQDLLSEQGVQHRKRRCCLSRDNRKLLNIISRGGKFIVIAPFFYL